MNDTIIFVDDKTKLSQCQLKYLQEWQKFGEQVCFKWARKNYCLNLQLSKLKSQMTYKNREITELTRAKIMCKKELQLERHRVYDVTRRNKTQDKLFKEQFRKLEDIILDREQCLYRFWSDHLLNDIQKQLELFVEKELMLNNFRQITDTFNELKWQCLAYVHSLILENKNLRLDIDKINENHRHQLANLRSANEEVNKSLASQVQCIVVERDRLRTEHLVFSEKKLHQVKKLESMIAAERSSNVKLNEEILRVREDMSQKDTWVREEIEKRIEEVKWKMTISFRIKTKLKQKMLSRHIIQVNSTLNQLEGYLPEIAKIFSKFKLGKEELTVKENQMVKLKNDLITEAKTSNKLQDEISRLKNELSRVNDVLNQLENCLPPLEKTFSELKLENKDLRLNTYRMDQLKIALIAEEKINAKLHDEITCLKNEKNLLDNWWQLEVQKRITESKKEMTEVHNNTIATLNKSLERAVKKGERTLEMLAEESISSSDKDQLIKLKDQQIAQLKLTVQDLNCSLAEKETINMNKWETDRTNLIKSYENKLVLMQKKYRQLKKRLMFNTELEHEMSSGDHNRPITIQNNINNRYFIQMDGGQKSKHCADLKRGIHNTVETTYQIIKEVRSCSMPTHVIHQLGKELNEKANIPQ